MRTQPRFPKAAETVLSERKFAPVRPVYRFLRRHRGNPTALIRESLIPQYFKFEDEDKLTGLSDEELQRRVIEAQQEQVVYCWVP
jgi:hypothetical protein